ncbi:MAG: hypothetical protein NZO16_00810 [Deltaproteobacteria bacterium]|nr:hypothetical protein [Deltaproteobacteria bacterium]
MKLSEVLRSVKNSEVRRRVEFVVGLHLRLRLIVDAELNNLKYFSKGTNDLVTSLDLKVEQFLTEKIKKAFPEDSFLCEESGSTLGESGFIHVIDPIDLTRNLSTGEQFLSLYTLMYDLNPVFSIEQGFRPKYFIFGISRVGNFRKAGNFVTTLPQIKLENSFSYTVLHNFSVVQCSKKRKTEWGTFRDCIREVLTGELDAFVLSLDCFPFFAWDYLPSLHLLSNQDIEVTLLPKGDLTISRDGILRMGNKPLQTVLAVRKSKKTQFLSLLENNEEFNRFIKHHMDNHSIA